jgi:Na+-transporting NADH:ubiquinone oxidoreductase subunit NqrB
MIWNAVFWKDATERAIKTFAQVILALGAAGALNAFQVDWVTVLGVGVGAMLLSYASSIVTAEIRKADTASLVKPE